MFSGAQTTPTLIFPGFRRPLNFTPDDELQGGRVMLFRTAPESLGLEDDESGRMPMLTLREIAMLRFMNEITDVQDWKGKISQESVTEKWRTEVMEQDSDFTQKMANYCLEELRHKAGVYKKTGLVSLFHGDVVKSDVAIPEDLREALKIAVAPLEVIHDHMKDWHPGSNGTVLDLVHPSLFLLVYGLSRIVTDQRISLETCLTMSGMGETVPVPELDYSQPDYYDYRGVSTAPYSGKFQWLPCDVDISHQGNGTLRIVVKSSIISR